MWTRFKRALRSFLGSFVSSVEDPELILQQNLRDMQDQLPKMNENIALVRANVTLLEKERDRLRNEAEDLTTKVQAAIRTGRDDIATSYATRLHSLRESAVKNDAQLVSAQTAYDKAIELRKVFVREMERKSAEAVQAIRDHRRAQWQAKVSDALESFRVGGIDQTHGEMLRKIEERTAINEARMHMALESVDRQAVQIEEEAARIRGEELVKRLKAEMGMGMGAHERRPDAVVLPAKKG